MILWPADCPALSRATHAGTSHDQVRITSFWSENLENFLGRTNFRGNLATNFGLSFGLSLFLVYRWFNNKLVPRDPLPGCWWSHNHLVAKHCLASKSQEIAEDDNLFVLEITGANMTVILSERAKLERRLAPCEKESARVTNTKSD